MKDKGFTKHNSKGFIEHQLTQADIEEMQKHKRLKSLCISHLKAKNLDFLLLMPNLEHVEFRGCTINDYSALRKIPKLKNLCFNTVRKDNNNFNFLNEGFENLEWLEFAYCPKFEVFPDLSACKNLQMLEIRRCKNLNDFRNIKTIPNLIGIGFSVYTKHQPSDLEFIAQIPHLKMVSCWFSTKKQKQEFDDLCKKHGKLEEYILINDKNSPKFMKRKDYIPK
ncbi:leucine-rich repeat domain-containing protein [Capnocytophaga cynodegmi]|uniref:hypothetical protein n=1 Tax=Capnocytophaga cynodegmi TaxID=28189 RepID=UPI00385F420B